MWNNKRVVLLNLKLYKERLCKVTLKIEHLPPLLVHNNNLFIIFYDDHCAFKNAHYLLGLGQKLG